MAFPKSSTGNSNRTNRSPQKRKQEEEVVGESPLDEYHLFIYKVNKDQNLKEHRTVPHSYDMYGGSAKRVGKDYERFIKASNKAHPGETWYGGGDVTLFRDDEGDPEDVRGITAPQVRIEDIPGQRMMRPKHEIIKMAKSAGYSSAEIAVWGDTIMESDITPDPEGWQETLEMMEKGYPVWVREEFEIQPLR
ncbi:Protein of unknown function [Pyronema omphalodes CBS 100304]|uniref:Uncharacterized protein n=1 Tax=Pyronema omphalodes (strain CBS 100304) TaxID=1076935 RepID=U4LEQ1_PYROM|nr:Protein of unknown function [Pyronema omphalodes CBS 100304]